MYGARGSSLSAATLSVSAGQALKDLVLKLTPGAIISGKVLDEEGEPVMSVAVMALRPMYQRGKRQLGPAGAAQSNDLGEYRIAGLAAGRYIVRATYRNLAAAMGASGSKPPGDKPELSYVTTYYPNSADADGAAPVEVGTGAEMRGTDIRLLKSKTLRVKGKLIGMPQGKTAVVMLTPKGAGLMGMLTGGMAVARPPDGDFEFRGIAPGSYVLSATAALDLGSLGASLPIEVGDQHIEGIALELGEGAELSGAVLVEGSPAADPKGAQFMLEPVEMVSPSMARASVGDDGKFTLKNVAPGRYEVRLTGGPETAYIKSVRFGGRDVTDTEIDLTSGVSGVLQITLSAAGAQVGGVIRGEDDKPVTGATVALIPDSKRYALYMSIATDQNGVFSFKGITPGDYKLLAWEDIEGGAFQDPEYVKPFESKAQALSLKENDLKTATIKVIPSEKSPAVR
jgi:hypothetical protein